SRTDRQGVLPWRGRASALRHELCETEIKKLHLTTFGGENISGLDVAVDDGFRVGRIESVGNLVAIIGNAFDIQGLSGNAVLEGLSFKDLHDNEVLAFKLVYIVDRANVGMIQRRSGPGFSLKTLDGEMILGNLFGEELHGDAAAKFEIFSLVNHTHAAATQLLQNAVVGNSSPNHRKETGIRSSYY